jgi:hypothetical protein
MKMELIGGSETSTFKTQAPGKYPKENILLVGVTDVLEQLVAFTFRIKKIVFYVAHNFDFSELLN